jgi:hypothetical protein
MNFVLLSATVRPESNAIISIVAINGIIIRQLTINLKGKVIAGYLNAMRHGSTDLPPA